jgi:hypothetical protein
MVAMQKLFIGENNLVTVSCPRCGKSREIDATPYLHPQNAAQITFKFRCRSCDCGHKTCQECNENHCANGNSNVFQLERRQLFRKKVHLAGTLIDRGGKKHPIRLLDISRTGIKMSVYSIQAITVGQRLKVEFTLDDAKESLIKKEIIVRKSAEKLITGEFTDAQSFDHDDKMIGFYLMK